MQYVAMTKKSTAKGAKSAKSTGTAASTAASNKVGKAQLVEMVAERGDMTKAQASAALDTMLDVIVGSLKDGKSVGLAGLGTLSVKDTAARTGVRPGTTERLEIPAGKKVSFKVATTLKGNL